MSFAPESVRGGAVTTLVKIREAVEGPLVVCQGLRRLHCFCEGPSRVVHAVPPPSLPDGGRCVPAA